MGSGVRWGLLRQRDFRRLWVGETTSNVGSAVTTVAMPLVAVTTLHASAFVVGVLSAAVWLPWLVIGLPAGAWVDRLARKPLMLVCDLVSALVLASVPVAAWCGVLTTAQLLVVALLSGVASVFFKTGYHVFLPAVVRREELPEANAKVQASGAASYIAGPGLGGLLAQLFGAVTGVLADAASFLVSAAQLLGVRAEEVRPGRAEAGRNLLQEIREGLHYTFTDPYLRPFALYAAAANLCFTALEAVLVVFLVRTVGVGAGVVGGLIAAGGVGGVIGALLATTLIRRFGTARTLLLADITTMPFALLIPLTTNGPGLVLFVIGMLVTDAGVTVGNVIIGSFRQSYVPRELLGRSTTSARCIAFGAAPIGALAGGGLAAELDPRSAVWIATVAQALSVMILLAGPLRKRRDLPESADERAVASAGP